LLVAFLREDGEGDPMNRFIVGTGRCGSTLLSSMLAENRSLLMIFEFFSGLDIDRRFGTESFDGRELAALLSEDTPAATMVTQRGYEIPEMVYSYRDGSRYVRGRPIPWILGTALARMSDDPDSLFDEVLALASSLPRRPLSLHYRVLFNWLAARTGRECWIEKSGSSIECLGALRDFFPDARFLHLQRDGREAALSMREHHVYRLWVSMMFSRSEDALSADDGTAALGAEAALGATDAITQMLESKPPVEYFGRYWTQLIARGFRCLGQLDAEQYREIRFEDLVANPREVLRTIGEFFELDAEKDDWIDRAAGLVRGIPPTRFERLSADEQRRLADACRVGQQLLGQVD
jgi:putative sulfotransferase